MKIECPACGSQDIREEQVSESMPIPYGSTASFTTTQHTCNVCGESGDFSGVNSSIINDAIRKSSAESAAAMLEYLAQSGISSAYFERAMRLPMRTTSRWKSGELSAAALALLRSVRTYPWLLEVADANFTPIVASTKLLGASAGVLAAVLEKNVTEAKVGCMVSTSQVNVVVELNLAGQSVPTVFTESTEQVTNSNMENVACLTEG